MRYEIVGETLPADLYFRRGETMITEKGAMSWMSLNMKMETSTNGGSGKAFGEDVFRRVDFPEHVHCKRRSRNDRVCIQFSGKDRCT